MKKISMLFFAAIVMVSLAACSGTKKTEEVAQVEETAVVEEAPAPEAVPVEVTPAEALKAFQAFAKEYGEAFNSITKDPQKFSTLASQVQLKVADMERLRVNLNPQQLKDYEKALKIITDVNSGGKK